MNWLYPFGKLELGVLITFSILYFGYIIRAFVLGKRVNNYPGRVFYKLFLRTVYIGLFIVSLLGPSFGEVKKEVKTVAKDIFFCIDLSKSMDATDINPSRLQRLKFELKKITDQFATERKGIIIFSSEAFVQCPLTYDNGAIQLFIETLNTGLVPSTGTDYAPALELALEKHTEPNKKEIDNKSKVIILISDGEDFGDNASKTASNIEDNNIKLYTLGIGTENGSKIPQGNGFKKDKQGNDVVTKLNSTDLKQIASKTGGKYFEISDKRNDVKSLIEEINNIKGELRDIRVIDATANKYFYFLMLGMFLFVIDIIITVNIIKL
jgi:Ca-activated chloride channel homolog